MISLPQSPSPLKITMSFTIYFDREFGSCYTYHNQVNESLWEPKPNQNFLKKSPVHHIISLPQINFHKTPCRSLSTVMPQQIMECQLIIYHGSTLNKCCLIVSHNVAYGLLQSVAYHLRYTLVQDIATRNRSVMASILRPIHLRNQCNVGCVQLFQELTILKELQDSFSDVCSYNSSC